MSDVTSIAQYATTMSQAQLSQQVSTAVMRKSLDATKQQGQAAIALLEAAAQVAKNVEPGKGIALDVTG